LLSGAELLDIFILFNKFKYFIATYKELFILLGTTILVWLMVVIIIKKYVRKDDKNDFLGNYTDDE
jgi:hypothetical protein